MKWKLGARQVRLVILVLLMVITFPILVVQLSRPTRLQASPSRQSGGTYYLFLPFVTKPDNCPNGIKGYVSEGGVPTGGVSLQLRFFNGSSWSTYATTTSAGDGCYSFVGVTGLSVGQAYYVSYQNPSYTYNERLWYWGTRQLASYAGGSSVNIGNFDIANVSMVSPSDGMSVTLPYTFTWTPRPATTADSYAFELIGNDFWSSPRLGYLDGFTLDSLPANYDPDKEYTWEVGVYSSDGGYGFSYYHRAVTFTNRGLGSPYAPVLKTPSATRPEGITPNPRE